MGGIRIDEDTGRLRDLELMPVVKNHDSIETVFPEIQYPLDEWEALKAKGLVRLVENRSVTLELLQDVFRDRVIVRSLHHPALKGQDSKGLARYNKAKVKKEIWTVYQNELAYFAH